MENPTCPNDTYIIEESASDFYAELLALSEQASADLGRAYERMAAVFRRAIDQRLRHSPIAFAGTFAKVDHLLRSINAEPRLVRQVNDTRDRLRHADQLAQRDMRRLWPHDLKSVCRFIAAIYPGEPMPAALAARLPKRDRDMGTPPPLGQCLRVVVEGVGGGVATVTADTGAQCALNVGGEWQGVARLIAPGTQLNLVRPRLVDGRLEAELVIVEPDYLVDISSIAACFESYGASPYTHLLNQLRPAPQSPAILLGNLASQLLDEAVNAPHLTYAESVGRFFRDNAIAVASCPGLAPDFHTQAKLQREHIRRAIDHVLPRQATDTGGEATLLEPSFFCEMLGLQGRMDFLRIDPCRPSCCTLLEQKSGKGGFPPMADPQTPRHSEPHYVQLLLYMAMLHYGHGMANTAIDAYLLYSRYANSLLKLGPAPQLLRQALALRNEIVALHMHVANGHAGFLTRLTADHLNTRGAAGRLWEQWQRPAIEATLEPLRVASPVERAYFCRFVAFIEREHLLSKVGNKTKECSGFASKWHDTLAEKLAAGNIVCPMTVGRTMAAEAEAPAVGAVTMALGSEADAEGVNFRPGDVVIVYSYQRGHEPDARRAVVIRATIERMTAAEICLRLRRPQASADAFRRPPGHAWAMEHDLFESSSTALLRAMHAFLRADKHRRDLILGLRRPAVAPAEPLCGHYGDFDTLVGRAMQARDLFLVVGPPGTGKTSFAMLNILREQLLSPGAAVLLAAYTNRAVDEMCLKLVEAGIDFVRMGSATACAEPLRPHLLERRASQCATADDVRALIAGVRVVCATTASLNANPALLGMKHFHLAIIDEASQILEPHIVGLMAAQADGRQSIGRFVLIGDHKQLPAVVQQGEAESAIADPQLRSLGITDCRQSLFERLLRAHGDDPAVAYMLTRQGRMHRDIAAFPSAAFYEGRLQVVPLPHQERPLPPAEATHWAERALRGCRVAFVAVGTPGDDLPDKVNAPEAEVVAMLAAEVCREMGEAFDPADSLGIIVPYRSQISAIRQALVRTGMEPLERVAIDTVERFQGSQRHTIIYDFTIRKPYQLNFLAQSTIIDHGHAIDRKLNVAMTRAREHLVMVGCPRLLALNPIFAHLLGQVTVIEPQGDAKGR